MAWNLFFWRSESDMGLSQLTSTGQLWSFLVHFLTSSGFHKSVRVLLAQWCLTLCDPMDCSPPGFSVHGILQARRLEWIAISLSKGTSWPRDQERSSPVLQADSYRLPEVTRMSQPVAPFLQQHGVLLTQLPLWLSSTSLLHFFKSPCDDIRPTQSG